MNFLKSLGMALGVSTLLSAFSYWLLGSDWLSIILFLATFMITATMSKRVLSIKSAQQQNIGLRDIEFTTNQIKTSLVLKEKFNLIKRQRISSDKSKIVYDIIALCDNIFNRIEQNPLLYYGNELFFLEELPLADSLIEQLLAAQSIEKYNTQIQQLLTLLQDRQHTILNKSTLDEQTALAMLQERTKQNEQQVVKQQIKIK